MDNRIHILRSDLLEPDEKVAAGFDEVRRERLSKMKSDVQRRETYTSGVLIERIRPEGAEIRYEKNGKPYFFVPPQDGTGMKRSFSITHSAGMVFCVWSDFVSVGADYEKKNRKVGSASARRLCTEKELDFFYGIPEKELAGEWLIKLFTRKEAVSKLTGKGINTDFTQMEDKAMTGSPFDSKLTGEVVLRYGRETERFSVETKSISDGFLSVAKL